MGLWLSGLRHFTLLPPWRRIYDTSKVFLAKILNSDDLSSNPVEAYIFFCKNFCLKITEIKQNRYTNRFFVWINLILLLSLCYSLYSNCLLYRPPPSTSYNNQYSNHQSKQKDSFYRTLYYECFSRHWDYPVETFIESDGVHMLIHLTLIGTHSHTLVAYVNGHLQSSPSATLVIRKFNRLNVTKQ